MVDREIMRPIRSLERIEADLNQYTLEFMSILMTDPEYTRYLYNRESRQKYKLIKLDKDSNDRCMFITKEIDEYGINTYEREKNILISSIDLKKYSQFCVPKRYINQSKQLQLPKELKAIIKEYQEYWEYWDQPGIEEIEKKRIEEHVNRAHSTFDNYNNGGRIVRAKDLYKVLEEVRKGEQRIYGESRPVIFNGELFINASAAIETTEEYESYKNQEESRNPQKDGDKLYQACESNGKFKGNFVEYADADTIEAWINSLKEQGLE